MKVHIVEDDYSQFEWISTILRKEFGNIDIERVRAEGEFRQKVDAIVQWQPDIVIMDVMLPWATPPTRDAENSIPYPDDIRKAGYYRAGLRCQELLSKTKGGGAIPVIIYTILEKGDLGNIAATLPANVKYLGKSSNSRQLIRLIRSMTGQKAA